MKDLKIYYERQEFFKGFDKKFCKTTPKIIKANDERAMLIYTMLNLSGSDVFNDSYIAISSDSGKTFNTPKKLTLFQSINDGVRQVYCSTCAFYHKKTNTFVSVGAYIFYKDDNHPIIKNGNSVTLSAYTTFDYEKGDYVSKPIIIKDLQDVSVLPFGQPIEYENGDVMLSFYGENANAELSGCYTALFSFDGANLKLKKLGMPVVCDKLARGFAEPSLAKLNDKYFFTLRADENGYLAVSNDGFNFGEPMVWKWDDGSVLENYNTQQRWLRFKDGLYLAYTRKGANNDHVFRHRAPMFMSRFDEDNLCLIKSTEVILVPELGARLGNFDVTDVSDTEAWLVTAEWMQTWPPEWYNYEIPMRYGADNRIWRAIVKIEE